eukprot:g2064.t1
MCVLLFMVNVASTAAYSVTWTNPCLSEPLSKTDVCDTTKSNEERVDTLIGLLKPLEKAVLMSNTAGAVPRLNIPAYQWWSEALHGVGKSPGVDFNGTTPFATSFPQVVTTSSSYNKTLFHAIGEAVGTEGRAFFNNHHAGLTFWAPNVNIFRDPRWGRGQETPGEDPILTSAYAANFPLGFQSGESYPKYLKASSCCKHYSGYDLENWDGVDRHHFNAIISQQDLNDTYFPAFQSCVQESKVTSVMCSYNAVNGVPSCIDSDYLNGQLRKDWGFEGYITSDCQAVEDVYDTHNYTKTPSQTIVGTFDAGMDSDCGNFMENHLKDCINDGICTDAVINPPLKNLFLVQFRLGLYDPQSDQPYSKISVDDINTEEHKKLALEAAEQGMVLLKNEDNALPLKNVPSLSSTIAVIGPNGNATETLLGNYEGDPEYKISVFEGLCKVYAKCSFESACDNVACGNTSKFAAVADLASNSDVVVLVIGLDQTQESEGHDRTVITLPGEQEALLNVVAAASKNKIHVVVMGGGGVDLTAAKQNDNVGSILWTGYPGQSGGIAIANTLTGKNVPSGRLTQTFYPASFVDDVSMFDMNMRPNVKTGNPGRSYRFYTGTPVFKFGDGLSYNKFNYSMVQKISRRGSFNVRRNTTKMTLLSGAIVDEIGDKNQNDLIAAKNSENLVEIPISIANKGPFSDAAEVVMVYVHPPKDSKEVGLPIKSLRWFDRVKFKSVGDKIDLNIVLKAQDFRVARSLDGKMITPRGQWTVEIGHIEQPLNHIVVIN